MKSCSGLCGIFYRSALHHWCDRCGLKMNHHTRFAENKKPVQTVLLQYKQLGFTSACVTEFVYYSSLCVLKSLGKLLMLGAKIREMLPRKPPDCHN